MLLNPAADRHQLYLDEKWFYLNSNRCKVKNLPKQKNEPATVHGRKPKRKIKSRRFETKVMFIAVIGSPTPLFNGLIGIWEVAKEEEAKKGSSSSNMCYNTEDQTNLVNDWRSHCNVNMTLEELRTAVDENFNLDVDKKTLGFVARIKDKPYHLQGKTKIKDSKVKSLAEYELKVQRKKGDTYKKGRPLAP